jgi:hypothetical protein
MVFGKPRALLVPPLVLCVWATSGSAQTRAPGPTWDTYTKQVEAIRDARPGERRALINRFRTINRANKAVSRSGRRGRIMTAAMSVLKGGSHVEALGKLTKEIKDAAARDDVRTVARTLTRVKQRQGRARRRLLAANRVLGKLGLSWARAHDRVHQSMRHHSAVLKKTDQAIKQNEGWLRERATEKLRQRDPTFAKNLERLKALDVAQRDITVTWQTVVAADQQLQGASTRRKLGAGGLVLGLATGGAGWIAAGVGGAVLARGSEGRAQELAQLVSRNLGCLKANKALKTEGLPVVEGGVEIGRGHGGVTAFVVPHYSILSNLFFNNRQAARAELGRLDRGLTGLYNQVKARRAATYRTLTRAIDREVQSYAN